MSVERKRPPRTFGLSVAILASVILFTVMPLIQLIWLALIRVRVAGADFGPGTQPFAVGSFFTNLSGAELILRVGLGLAFLVVAVFAWRGRPRSVRFVMLAAVLVMTALTIIVTLAPLFREQTLADGIDSGDTFRRVVLGAELFLTVLIPLYVVWYINRGPARAFYRGYYLSEPAGQKDQPTA